MKRATPQQPQAATRVIWREADQSPDLKHLNHAQRRAALAEHRRRQKRTAILPLGETDIPPGSLLSNQTLEAIREGRLAFARYTPPRSSPRRRPRPLRPAPSPLAMVAPWVPLLTPISQAELDRMRAAKRLARAARKGKK